MKKIFAFPLVDVLARTVLARPFRLLGYIGATIIMILVADWLVELQDEHWLVINPATNHVGNMRLLLIETLLGWRLLIPLMACHWWIRKSQIRAMREAFVLTPMRLRDALPAIVALPVLITLIYHLLMVRPTTRQEMWLIYREVPEEWWDVLRAYLWVSSFWFTAMMAAAVTTTVALCRFTPRAPVFVAASMLPIGIATYNYTAYYLTDWIGLEDLLREGIVWAIIKEITWDFYAGGIMLATTLLVLLVAQRKARVEP